MYKYSLVLNYVAFSISILKYAVGIFHFAIVNFVETSEELS